jgi:hypothetical protein
LKMELWLCNLYKENIFILVEFSFYSKLYKGYKAILEQEHKGYILYRSFINYFDEFAPEVELKTPHKDVCNACVKFRLALKEGMKNGDYI